MARKKSSSFIIGPLALIGALVFGGFVALTASKKL